MTENMLFTPDQVKKAVAVVQEQRPAYAELLNFYKRIFTAQEESKLRINIKPILISEDILSLKVREHLPLISVSDFAIDLEASKMLLKNICSIAQDTGNDMAVSARELSHAAETGKIDTELLFSGILNEDDSFFEKIATEFEIRKNVLAFIAYGSINPCLCLCADQVSTYLDKNDRWEKGYCPVCGSQPCLSMVRGEGERFLFCGFCWQKWAVQRIYCPFCDNNDSRSLHYFFSEQEKEYRVSVCDKCGKYIKTVDTRKSERIFYPPLEQVSTLHLDMMAKEKGLESGMHLFLQ